jgi:hypothetical protein
MIETIVVIGIVLAAAGLLARSFYRSAAGKKTGCGCGKGACSMAGTCHGAAGKENHSSAP